MYLCLYIVNRLVKLQINHLQNLKKKKVKYYFNHWNIEVSFYFENVLND